MVRLRGISGAVFVSLVGCAPHERPQEPASDCPTGMVAVGGDAGGTLAVSKFCMDITEVTTAAYGACVQAGVCTPAIFAGGADCNLTKADRADHPINCTAWDQAQTYCGWLGKRLPDDEEWIWAAQGGTQATPYPWGRTPPDATRACWDRKTAGTCPVGGFPGGASPAGILDLIGNAAEWTRGYTGGKARQAADETGGRGRLRGGSFHDKEYRQPIDERWADSARDEPTEAATVTSGLRCVVSPHTPVQEVDDSKWTPYVPTASGLPPVLAATPVPTRPTRPLANLAILDHHVGEDSVWWALGDGLIPIVPAVAAGFGLTDHVQIGAQPAALKGFRPLRWIGDMVLMTSNSSYDLKLIAVEPATFKLRWQTALAANGTSYEQVITPRTLVAAFSGAGASNDTLVGYALDSGREVWRVHGAMDVGFSKVQRLWSDGERGYVIGDRGLLAYDANTGAQLWVGVSLAQDCGVASAPNVLVVEDPDGHRVLDPTTGATVRRIGKPGSCGWGASSWDSRIPGAAIADGRLIVFDPVVQDENEDAYLEVPSTLRAYDLATGAERWRRPKLLPQALVADQDAVYVSRDGSTLLALDAATGATRAVISFGSTFWLSVQPGGGEAGPLVVVDANATGQWILGRAPAPVPLESYVVRGRLVAPEGVPRRRAANLPVRVGDRIVRTGPDGRFEVRGKALGAVEVSLGMRLGPHEADGRHFTFSASPIVLDGSGKYDAGDIEIHEWSFA